METEIKGKTKEGYSCANILKQRYTLRPQVTRFEFAASLTFKFYFADFFFGLPRIHCLLTQDDLLRQ
jgi:hypothetical protein